MPATKSDIRIINRDKLIAEINELLPISDVAESLCGVELVQAGHQMKGLCPIHDEDTPSFHVKDSTNVFHCFGCKAGGDSIELIQRVRHVEFYEALYLLAAEAGIDITQYEREMTPEEKERDRLRRQAEGWMHSGLAGPEGAELQQRMGDEGRQVCIDFGVFTSQGASAGMARDFDDWMMERNATIFPYRTGSGKLIGWKARYPNKSKFFMVSKDNPIYEVGFFGMDVAREHIRERNEVIVVEGEYDCMVLHQFGFKNVVAIGGSKFTDDHMAILQNMRIANVVFAMDGDEGGQGAARSIAERWWQGDMRVSVVVMPEGKDPEDVVRDGAWNFAVMLGEARWALEWLLFDEWTRRGSSMGDKLAYLGWVAENYGNLLSPMQEQVVMQDVAKWLQLPEAQILDFGRPEKSKLQAVDSERVIIGRCIREQNYYTDLRKRMSGDDFFMVRHRRIWAALEALMIDDLTFEIATVRHKAVSMGVDAEYVDDVVQVPDGNMVFHEEKVSDLATRRIARDQADRFRDRIADPNVDTRSLIGDLTQQVTSRAIREKQGETIQDQVDSAMETLHERMANPDAVHGLSFGPQFNLLSQKLQGIQKRRLVFVAAKSGAGKSTITLQWSVYWSVMNAIPVDFISLEMDVDEILFKAASHLTGINAEKITGGALEPWEATLVEQAMLRIRKSPFKVYAPDDFTPSEFVLYAREARMQRRTEVFIIDYAQMISPDPQMQHLQLYQQLKEFGRMAKIKVARGMDCSVIMPAQLNKQSAEKERPTKEDMGDSYDLSRTADVVMIIKDYEDSDTIDFWLDKNRQGPGGVLLPMVFHKEVGTFYEQGSPKDPDYRLAPAQS